MSAAALSENELLADLPLRGGLSHRGHAERATLTDGLCPICEHPLRGIHREIFPWDDPPMLLCFLMVEGRRCFSECGACRRGEP
jgi:hypothetical protein